MDKNNRTNIFQILKISFLLGFVLAGFFGFGLFVQAAGSVTFSSVKVSSPNVTDGQTLRVTPILSDASQAGSSDITVQTFVNGQKVGSIPTSVYSLLNNNGSVYQDIPVSAQNGFKVGQNYINVTIIGSDGSNYGNQNAPVVTYASQSQTTGSNKANGAGCTLSPECQSNYCDNSGVCDSCQNYSNDVCNTGGATGYTCNSSGVCVLSQSGQTCTPACTGNQTCQNGTCQAATTGTSANSATTLYNPIQSADNLTSLFINIMKGFLAVIGIWAVVFIVIGGFEMVVSSGNEEMYTKAKKTIIWAVLGLAVAVLSFAIIAIVENLVGIKIQAPTSMVNLISFL